MVEKPVSKEMPVSEQDFNGSKCSKQSTGLPDEQ